MKKVLAFAFVAALVVFATSCSKSSSTSNSWSFKGTSYGVYSSPTASTTVSYTAISPVGVLYYNFANTPTAGTYTVVGGVPTSATQVAITFTNTSSTYNSTGGNGTQTVAVTVSGTGKVTVALPSSGAMLSNGTDSSAVTGTTTQP